MESRDSRRQQAAALLRFGDEDIIVCDTLNFGALIEASRQLGT